MFTTRRRLYVLICSLSAAADGFKWDRAEGEQSVFIWELTFLGGSYFSQHFLTNYTVRQQTSQGQLATGDLCWNVSRLNQSKIRSTLARTVILFASGSYRLCLFSCMPRCPWARYWTPHCSWWAAGALHIRDSKGLRVVSRLCDVRQHDHIIIITLREVRNMPRCQWAVGGWLRCRIVVREKESEQIVWSVLFFVVLIIVGFFVVVSTLSIWRHSNK